MHCKYVSLSVLHTQLGLHTIVDAELSRICVTQSQNITPVRAKKRGEKGRERKKEQRMPCLPRVGMGRGGRRGGGGGEKKYIYSTYIPVCVHNVEEVFL